MENKRKHPDKKLAATKKWRNYLVFKPNYYPKEIISNRNEKNPQMFINRSVYVGVLILEIIRIVTYEFNSTTLRCESFSEKNIKEMYLCNYYYFSKSNTPMI